MDMQVGQAAKLDSGKAKLDGRSRSLANLIPARKGEVRNPSGRPKKDYDLAKMALKHAQKAVDTLVEVMSDTTATPSARVSAASEILERGFGRAPQSLNVKHEMTFSEQFEDFLRQISGRPRAHVIDADVLDAAE